MEFDVEAGGTRTYRIPVFVNRASSGTLRVTSIASIQKKGILKRFKSVALENV